MKTLIFVLRSSASPPQLFLRQSPQDEQLWNELGNTWRASGNVMRALHCYRAAIGYHPIAHQASLNLGVVLRLLNHTMDAARVFLDNLPQPFRTMAEDVVDARADEVDKMTLVLGGAVNILDDKRVRVLRAQYTGTFVEGSMVRSHLLSIHTTHIAIVGQSLLLPP